MKSEKLLHAIGKIRDTYVQEAAPDEATIQRTIRDQPPIRRRGRPWLAGAVAAVLVVAVCAGSVLLPGTSITASAVALAEAEYPQWAQMPDETEYILPDYTLSESYYEQYDAWWAQRRAAMDKRPDAAALATAEPFTTQTLRALLTGTENRVCSPMNLYIALAMLAETTGGQSRQQILELLGVQQIQTLRAQTKAIWESMYVEDGSVTTRLANSVWLRQDGSYRQPLLDTLAQDYYASSYAGEMGSQAFNQAMQDWINEQTGGLLQEQAEGLELDSNTVMALISTLYFRARWHSEFDPEKTTTELFYCADGSTTECDFMHRRATALSYYYGEGYTAVSLSFDNSGAMLLMLPDEGWTTEELLQNEAACSLLRGAPNVDVQSAGPIVNLAIPKFDVASDLELTETLQALGIVDVFTADADFSPLAEQEIRLSQVQHAARVKVDEEGCEAAAFTVMATAGSAEPPDEEVDFILDRPFLFSITGLENLPLFVGTVQNPTA